MTKIEIEKIRSKLEIEAIPKLPERYRGNDVNVGFMNHTTPGDLVGTLCAANKTLPFLWYDPDSKKWREAFPRLK